MRFADHGNFLDDLVSAFSPNFFFFLLLPPILFDGGLNAKRKRFFANIGTISSLAIVGTLVSTGVIGGLLVAFSPLFDVSLSIVECILMGGKSKYNQYEF